MKRETIMKIKNLSIILIALLLGIAISLPSYADELDQKLTTALNTTLAQYGAADGFSALQLSILLPNETTPRDYTVGQQMKDGTCATNSMMVQWGSIIKEFTSLLLFQYLNKHPGSFSLNTTVETMLPEHFGTSADAWPDAWKKVTIEQLMNMTSGITEYYNQANFDIHHVSTLNSVVEQAASLEKYRGCQLDFGCFPAGTQWYYSNTNYIILGMMVEKLYQTSFAQVMQQQVLQKMGGGVVYQTPYSADTLNRMINGYYEGVWQPYATAGQNVTNINLAFAASAGALTGSTDALVETIHALFTDQFLPHAQMQQFLYSGWIRVDTHQAIDINSDTAKKVCTNIETCYGLGFLAHYNATYGQVWEYPGGTLGFVTDYIWMPQENVVIGLSINTGGPGSPGSNPLGSLRDQVEQIVYNHLHPGK